MTQARRWSLLATLVIGAVLASGWFLLISPKRTDASDLLAQTAKAEEANVQLRAKLQQLKALAPELPKREAEFAAIRRQIPNNPALPDLIRQLTAASKKSGTSLTSLAPATPILLVPPGAPLPATGAAPTASNEQLMQLPLAIQVDGSYSQLEDFVDRLEKLRRVVLVSAFTLGPGKSGTSDALSLALTSRVYMANTVKPMAITPGAATAATNTTTPASGTSTPSTTQPAN